MIGTIHPKGTMLLRERVGEAETKNGVKIEMSLVNFHTPCIECINTGKFYTVSWADLLELAMAAGVADPVSEANNVQ
ncbi:hypothetical protein ACQE3E_15495 [Methylomonas sp. MED-D]|uniref:hypothetical protein n=1 Tax=Methylomonas sp. MED-D TaxID=3418768 RepID=UPI003D073D2D